MVLCVPNIIVNKLITYHSVVISELSFGPHLVEWALIIFVLWVVVGGIIELTVVVLGVEVGLNGVGNSEEVGHVLAVGEVLVKVVLEMLEHVHVLLDHSVSSNSWEGEGVVIELPGVDVHSWFLTGILHGIGNVLSIGPVSGIKSSGEHVNLIVQFLLSFIEVDTWALNGVLDLGGFSEAEENAKDS